MELNELIENYFENKKKVNIAIAGCTCSGKSTLSKEIRNVLSDRYSVSIIEQDSYFKNIEDIPTLRGRYLMDSPNSFETKEFKSDTETHIKEGKVIIPKYDINTNKRLSKDVLIYQKDINIFEGLHVINLLNDLEIYKIFLNTSIEKCLERRIERDRLALGVSKDQIQEYFESYIIPQYKNYIIPQKEKADLIINNEMEGKWLLKKLSKN